MRFVSLLLALASGIVSGSAAWPPPALEQAPPNPNDEAAFRRYIQEGRDSPFGLDYVFVLDPRFRKPDLARDLGGTVGVRWVNFAHVGWGQLEPRPPRAGRHAYDWAALDEGVRQWQQYGVHIMMSLRLHSPWGTARPSGEEFTYLGGLLSWIPRGGADYLPKPEHAGDFRDFIAALVERYDGDGAADMPGLRFPVLHYQVGNECYNELFWAGTVEEYGQCLSEVAGAARRACPQVKLILSGVTFRRLYGFYDREMDPRTRAYVEGLLPQAAPKMRPFVKRSFEFCQRSIAFRDYDILDVRWPYYGVIAAWREALRQAGRPDTEVWSAEVYAAVPLLDAMVLEYCTLQPYPTPTRSLEYIRILRNRRHRDFGAVNRWYRAHQAAMVVKYCMPALEAGSRKLMVGWALDDQTPLAPYPLAVDGFKSLTFERLWPAAYTYRLLIGKLDGISACRRLPAPDTAYVYECTVRGGRRVLVAFCDDHIAQNHDESSGTVAVAVPFDAPCARLTRIVTELDQTQPEVETLTPAAGELRLTLTEFPIFLERGGP